MDQDPFEGRSLPDAVRVARLTSHTDGPSRFTELFRSSWGDTDDLVQWNVVSSRANVLRGVQCHRSRDDYVTILRGRMTIGLCDLRPSSPTYRRACTIDVTADEPTAIAIPVGVAHGFYFPVASIHVIAVTRFWDSGDEYRCHWTDPGLDVPWPDITPVLSDSDASAGSLEAMEEALLASQRG